MSWKAWLKLTFVFGVLIGLWILGRILWEGSVPPPITEIRLTGGPEAASFRLPVALPFWIDLLAAPLISGLIAATAHIIRSDTREGADDVGVGTALAFFWVFSIIAAAAAFLATNVGLLISFLVGTGSVGAAFASISLAIAGGIKIWEWINAA